VQQVLIIRHGETEWNATSRWQGWLDIPLNGDGEAQAMRRARQLRRDGFNPRAIYCSDLKRAARTAEIIAAHLEVPSVPDAGLRERNGGDWQGHTTDEIREKWPGLLEQWRHGEVDCPPGGENDANVLARFDAALVRALAHVGTGMLAIVMHGGILRAVAVRAGADHHTFIPNLGGFWFDVDVDGSLGNPQPVGTLPTDAERQGEE
jgi:glucosyl-3-phosphoglycerate phosphatase